MVDFGCENEDEKKEEDSTTTTSTSTATANAQAQSNTTNVEGDSVVDISPSGCSLSSLTDDPEALRQTNQVYVFDNVFTVLPNSIKNFKNLKVLKLFSNEVKYLPSEVGELQKLEQLQIRVSPLGLNSLLPVGKVTGLKVLELHQVPPRPSLSSIPVEISQLHGLTRLSICHFSISFLPPEIGSLENLEEMDFSFNNLKLLPSEISRLGSLKILKVASNKLVELPSSISDMPSLQSLNVGYNRLTSLEPLDLHNMTSLQSLNAEFNKIETTGVIPDWIQCNLDGNMLQFSLEASDEDEASLEFSEKIQPVDEHQQQTAAAVEQGLTSVSRKHKLETDLVTVTSENGMNLNMAEEHRKRQERSMSTSAAAVSKENEIMVVETLNGGSGGGEAIVYHKNYKSYRVDSSNVEKAGGENGDVAVQSSKAARSRNDSLSEKNPKPSKRRKATEDFSKISYKYSKYSFCGISDHLHDGFYDAGRDHKFVTLDVLEREQLRLDQREVILLNRAFDEDLDVIASSAKKILECYANEDILQKVSMLALFVSDCFGGSDKTLNAKTMRRSALGCTSGAPFVCSCSTTTNNASSSAAASISSSIPSMYDLCDGAIRHIKLKRGSNVVPIGSIPYGVCRHRAILFKYLCDRSVPVIPCELIRGYLDYAPHAWNVVLVERNGCATTRILVDACRPLDVRPENDPEYFCRYISMRRIHMQGPSDGSHVELSNDAFVPLLYEEIGCGGSTAVVRRCTLGGHVAAAKVRHLDGRIAADGSMEKYRGEGRNNGWLSELRMHCSIGEHPCVVAFYGHQISFDFFSFNEKRKDSAAQAEVPQLVIFMEYIKGGSLESLIKGFVEDGHHAHAPPMLALHVARSVARGLAWLHSRGIIHRDIKSSNVLVDLDSMESSEDSPTVKICDFDSAVPAGSSSVHTCYLAHQGIPLADVCVGTPRWISPEVLNAIYTRQQYGLAADMWSFGCLVLELLTLKEPYYGIDVSEIHTYIKGGQRPSMKWKVEDLEVGEEEGNILKLLIRIFEMCTESEPHKRPTADEVVEMLTISPTKVTKATAAATAATTS